MAVFCPSVKLSCEHDISSRNAPRLTKFVGDMHLLGGQLPIENQFYGGHLGFSRWPPLKNILLHITRELNTIERKTQRVFLDLGQPSLRKLFSNFHDGRHLGVSR